MLHRRDALARAALLSLLSLACSTTPRPARTGAAPVVRIGKATVERRSPTGGYRGRFNNDDQGHADFCVRLTSPTVALRYADGSPSGFALTGDMLQPSEGNAVSCPEPGMARLDAREIVRSADGRAMLFHRGGWGFAGNDPASAVHYGHVLVSELDSTGLRFVRDGSARKWVPAPTAPWTGEGQRRGNGTPCARRLPNPVTVSVHSIPADMKYLNSKRTAAIPYAIYGSPAEDLGPAADRARGIRYTMLTWSWINVRGGGVARAIVKDGTPFYGCPDVPPIELAAVADARTQTPTGWVRAVYGAIRAGDGQWLYGWIVDAHQHGSEPIVRHLEP